MNTTKIFFIIFLFLALVSTSLAQGSSNEPTGDVLMLEEIRIEVAPELPTVVVTIPRQSPLIEPITLQKDPEDLIRDDGLAIKPKLDLLPINQLEEPEKMLAKDRSQ